MFIALHKSQRHHKPVTITSITQLQVDPPMSATAGLMQEHQLILKYIDLMERCAKLNLQKPDIQILFDQTVF